MPVRRIPRVAAIALALVVAVRAAPVHAHTDLDYTVPVDSELIAGPVSQVVVAFTDPVTLIGEGFEVLDPQGQLRVVTVETADDVVFTINIQPAMGGGAAGVRYRVTAADGHVIEGSFSFVITEPPAPSSAPPAVVTSPTVPDPANSAPEPTVVDSVVTTSASSTVAPTNPAVSPTTIASASVTPPTSHAMTAAEHEAMQAGEPSAASNNGLAIAGAGAVAVGSAAFLVMRRRRPA